MRASPAVATAAIALALCFMCACQSTPPPTPTPTIVGTGPTAAATSSSATPAVVPSTPSGTPTVSATISPEAESLVRAFYAEREKLARTGVMSQQMKSMVTGDAVDVLANLNKVVQENQRRYTEGNFGIAWMKPATDYARPGDLFVVGTCLDASGATMYENGVKVGVGPVVQEHYHLRQVDGRLLIDLITKKSVTSC